MTATFLQNMKDVQDCHNQIDRVKDELARSKSKWAAADRVRCKAAASACKARLKRAEQTANTLRKELADQKKMTELLNDDKSLFWVTEYSKTKTNEMNVTIRAFAGQE